MNIFMGVMSGTSVDAIDVVLADWSNPGQPVLLASISKAWPDAARQDILALAGGHSDSIDKLGELDRRIGMLTAEACLACLTQANMAASAVTAIGFHGQTIRHCPDMTPPFTLQIGDANTLAEMTGISVVSDFRRRDVAAGGQGAPLVPAFHEQIFGHAQTDTVVLNLGGIANITVLPGQADASETQGFDTGPANMLMDAWVQQHTGHAFDADGHWAASGQVDAVLLERLLAHPYFSRSAPKSTGRETFSLGWLNAQLAGEGRSIRPVDVQATLAEVTAISVCDAIRQSCQELSGEVLVCGGGANNTHLMARLRHHLTAWRIVSTASKGIDPQWIEALAFAWLARQMISGLPGNLPAVTGAHGPRILGSYHPATLGQILRR
ncbi:MAG: anhydro-N-acetylmuramic acid kinase [Pseudomonadota bacterium]